MKISIITITFNSELTVESTIKSVIGQNYKDLEYIIIDGGSRDKTLEIIKKYADNISIFVSEPDNGISDAFNKGINLASGELIGIINSDDILLPGSLNFLAKAINKEADIIYGNIIRWREKENIEKQVYANDNLEVLKHGFSCMFHPSTFIRRKAYEKYGLYKIDLRFCMDRELLLRMFKAGAKFQRLDYTFVKFRVGGASCKNYYKTAFESMNVSTIHDFPWILAFLKTIYNILHLYSINYIRYFLNFFGLKAESNKISC